jgi:CMP-N-acetylneuraminic acid synthetase
MIIIHWDFVDGTEISYAQGKLQGDNFTTHCLDFFNMDEKVDDVIVLRADGKKISRKNIQNHVKKEIRITHNIHKMLVANTFNWL